jgi:hypothetical protein
MIELSANRKLTTCLLLFFGQRYPELTKQLRRI